VPIIFIDRGATVDEDDGHYSDAARDAKRIAVGRQGLVVDEHTPLEQQLEGIVTTGRHVELGVLAREQRFLAAELNRTAVPLPFDFLIRWESSTAVLYVMATIGPTLGTVIN
jgi:hypothetical protein